MTHNGSSSSQTKAKRYEVSAHVLHAVCPVNDVILKQAVLTCFNAAHHLTRLAKWQVLSTAKTLRDAREALKKQLEALHRIEGQT